MLWLIFVLPRRPVGRACAGFKPAAAWRGRAAAGAGGRDGIGDLGFPVGGRAAVMAVHGCAYDIAQLYDGCGGDGPTGWGKLQQSGHWGLLLLKRLPEPGEA